MKITIYMQRLILAFLFITAISFQGTSQNLRVSENQNIELSLEEKENLVTLMNLHTMHNYASSRSLWRLYFDQKNPKDNKILTNNICPSGSIRRS